MLEQLLDIFKSFSGSLAVVLVLIALLYLNTFIFKRFSSGKATVKVIRRTIAFLLVFIGALILILALPIDKSLKGQILSFFGIIISAGIALSSTTVLGNMIAGIMNNSMKRFASGDLISIGEIQGRVTKKSIFHTEIQLEDSNFVTIPNLFIASNPVKLTRKSNTVISASVSLGYDVPRSRIEDSLKEAAEKTGLNDPYVYIMELGDYSVVYKIHGFLADSSKFFSTTSLLKANVMDNLHKYNIEIVSPTFMNQRRVDEMQFIPEQPVKEKPEENKKSPEELIFDKAIESEEIEKKREYLVKIDERKTELKEKLKELKDDKEVEKVKSTIKRLEDVKERLAKNIKEQEGKKE